MSRLHEPRRTTSDIRRLRTLVAEDAQFATLVFDLRELMHAHDSSSNRMRAALRLVLHGADWRTYSKAMNGLPPYDEEEEDVEDDRCDPLEF